MFKLVVLCTLLAAAVAEPAHFVSPFVYSTSVVAPATATITNQASSVIHPLPSQIYPGFYGLPYSPVGHLIKKRSAGLFSSYLAPSTYVAHTPLTYAATPLAASFIGSPLATTYAAPVYTGATHFIKKRSVAVLPTTYIAPTYPASVLTTTYNAAAHILPPPYISSVPFTYSHLIKKRSAPLLLPGYSVPASFSHQSRVDFKSSPTTITSYSYPAAVSYGSPVAFSHVF